MDQGRQFETAGIILENRVLIYQVDVCIGIHFFCWRIPSHGLTVRKRFCLEKWRRTAYSGCPKFFSSYIKSSGIIDELSLKN